MPVRCNKYLDCVENIGCRHAKEHEPLDMNRDYCDKKAFCNETDCIRDKDCIGRCEEINKNGE
jgi:hypothetical protein